MARDFTPAGDYLLHDAAILSPFTAPFTVSVWFNPVNITGNYTIFALGSFDEGVDNFWFLQSAGGLAGDPVRGGAIQGATLGIAETSTSIVANTWNHGALVEASSTSHSVYLDGGGKITNTDTSAPAIGAPYRNAIGVSADVTPVQHFDGLIAEVGLWNVALTDAEVAILALGYSPLFIRPQSLSAYWPLIGRTSPEIDRKGGYDMTINGTPSAAGHPPVIYPSRQICTPVDRSGLQIDIRPQRNYIQVV